ncbi:CPBP family intramembrane glutamic endopeptidase [Halorubrum rutilum]|uniref:CPBP family intramembrane glutamic endopeptidase n=1 Tax=Halorubrum rutilum TaxID=1364933 RepID=A0ABD6AK30_9EURY|nr:CPBP family intramembrane glutamic endopeptidase [Halorubrum rutilum]
MPDWAAFALATAALTLLLLYFTRRSQRLLERARTVDRGRRTGDDVTRGSTAGGNGAAALGENDGDGGLIESDDAAANAENDDEKGPADTASDDRPVLTTRVLLANAAASQATALVALAAIAWWTAVPATAFGVGGTHPTLGAPAFASLGTAGRVALGVAAGAALAAGNEAAARLGARVGHAPSDRLREAMAPGTPGEWALLLGVALPVVAVFEEALFRGALVGALAVGLAVDPWLLAVGSSVAFGVGHGAQGRLGVAVAGALGLGLAGLFVATGSLLAPVVAHYLVNAAEFVAHERP